MAHSAHSDPEMIREFYDSEAELKAKVDLLADFVRTSKHFVTFTGAGISTSAGIGDFRGPQGKWTLEAQGKRAKPGTPTISALPTPTHMALVELIRLNVLKYLISQNCDGLHRRSGIPADKMSELHGNSNIEICDRCGQNYLRDLSCHRYGNSRDHFTGRFCSRTGCGGALVEFTIDFGQNLPEEPLQLADQHSRSADLHLVLGSSLTVRPACTMPEITAKRGRLVIVNLQKTPLDELATIKIHAKTDVVMQMLMERLGFVIPPFSLKRRLLAQREEIVADDGDGGDQISTRWRISLKTVDIHDPSLELSHLQEVLWLDAPQIATTTAQPSSTLGSFTSLFSSFTSSSSSSSPSSTSPSSTSSSTSSTTTSPSSSSNSSFSIASSLKEIPVRLKWMGHYHESDLDLNVDLETAAVQDFLLSFDPYKGQWSTVDCQHREKLPKPSRLVKLQQSHGLSYIRSHWDYVVKGVRKANPTASKAACADAAQRHRQKMIDFVHLHKKSPRSGRVVKCEPISLSTTEIRVIHVPPSPPPTFSEIISSSSSSSSTTSTSTSSSTSTTSTSSSTSTTSTSPPPSSSSPASTSPSPKKIPIADRPGEFKKTVTVEQSKVMRNHTHQCQDQNCFALWQGPWGSFIGGRQGAKFFDLTNCPTGAQLNRMVGWDYQNPRV